MGFSSVWDYSQRELALAAMLTHVVSGYCTHSSISIAVNANAKCEQAIIVPLLLHVVHSFDTHLCSNAVQRILGSHPHRTFRFSQPYIYTLHTGTQQSCCHLRVYVILADDSHKYHCSHSCTEQSVVHESLLYLDCPRPQILRCTETVSNCVVWWFKGNITADFS